MNNKVVLAFSGGLDTSYCALYLRQIRNLEVHALMVDTGGFSAEELAIHEKRAKDLNVASFKVLDVTDRFYQECIRYLIFGNVLKNHTYPLSVSAERVFQAMVVAQYAREIGAAYIAHGSTGAGNDQVRFDMIFHAINPEAEVITPIRDLRLAREEEIEFLQENGIEGDWKKSQYSINQGLWGTSVGGVETLTSHQSLPEDAYPSQLEEKENRKVTIDFHKGEPVAIDDQQMEPVQLIKHLNQLGSAFAIGRDIHVGDTIIGIKGRVGFEAPAALMLIKAHQLLEKHVLTKWQLLLKDQQANWYGHLVHEGQFLEPALRDIEAYLTSTQHHVTGKVFLELSPYRFQPLGIESPHDLMSNRFGAYGEMNKAWTGDDVKGFSKIFGNQNVIYQQVNEHER